MATRRIRLSLTVEEGNLLHTMIRNYREDLIDPDSPLEDKVGIEYDKRYKAIQDRLWRLL